ncbi:MAG: sugar ABC transporter permease [Spirochaetales bacterium]|nr:sugar ABC transporter permease [Spirochaetales bacterium]
MKNYEYTRLRRLPSKRKKNFLEPYLFIAPFIILFLAFSLFPIIFSLVLSLSKWKGAGKMEYVGIENFRFLLNEDTNFWSSMFVTSFLLLFGSISQHFFALPLAIILNNRRFKGRLFFQTAYLLPYLTNAVIVATFFQFFCNTQNGWLNYILGFLGIENIKWFSDPQVTPYSLAFIINWRYIGWNVVLYLAGLQTIPRELYEAADMDGAPPFTKHRTITVPLIFPIIFFAVTLSIINGMQIFDEPYMLTNSFISGSPINREGLTAAVYIVYLMKRAGRFGRASALSWIVFLLIVLLTIFNRKVADYINKEDKL